jgi:hypothetical protein
MHIIRTTFITVLAVAAFASEAEPWLTVSIPDGAKSAERFNASIYGKIVNAPEFAPLKAKWTTTNTNAFMAQLQEAGINPLDLFAHLRFFDLVFQGAVQGKAGSSIQPGFRTSFDLGERFAQIAAKDMAKKVGIGQAKKIDVPGVEEAYVDINDQQDVAMRTLRFASQYVLTNADRADWQKPMKPVTAAHDLVLRWMPAAYAAYAAFADKARPAAERVPWASVLERMYQMTGTVEMTMDILPAGLATRIMVSEALTFTAPVDKAVLARLPAKTLSAIALGIDGAAWWSKGRYAFFKQLGQSQTPPISAEQMERNLNTILKGQGLTCSMAELVSGIKGTAVMALMQATPIPTAALAIPRSKGMDELVGLVLKHVQLDMPAEGAMAVIPLPPLVINRTSPDGMCRSQFTVIPLPSTAINLTLVRAPGHWLVTSDAGLASTWTGAASGGWLDTPASKLAMQKAGTDAWLVGSSDMATLVRMCSSHLQLDWGFTPEERQSVMHFMQILAQNAQTGWCTGRNKGDTWVLEMTGLTGGFLIPAYATVAVTIPGPERTTSEVGNVRPVE